MTTPSVAESSASDAGGGISEFPVRIATPISGGEGWSPADGGHTLARGLDIMDDRRVTPGAANNPKPSTASMVHLPEVRIQSVLSAAVPIGNCIVWTGGQSYVWPGRPGMTFWRSPTGRTQGRTTDNIATRHSSPSGNMDDLEGGTGW